MMPAGLHHAQAILAQRDLPAAVAAFDRAQMQGAEPNSCAAGRWSAHMLAGNFAAAWQQSDVIRQSDVPDHNRLWLGDDLRDKRVILRCLHGYGDAVQFLRYAPKLQALAAQLIVEVAPAMVDIARCFDGVNQLITWGPGAPILPVAWDLQVEIMELPYLFRTSMFDLPIATHYLGLPVAVERHAASVMGRSSLPRIGVVWAGGGWNPERFLPMSLLRPLLETPECDFWSLQGGRARDEWKSLPIARPLRDSAICGEGVLPLAATIRQLDLVITIDTLAAHLAGALGKPVWVLLPHAADWRWMTNRSDSPWYPSATLFRQAAPGDWASVMESVQRHLAIWQAQFRSAQVGA